MAVAIAFSTPVQAGEEIGWRGYALPRLTNQLGLARGSIVLGVIWACWHLPFFFIPGSDNFGQSFPLYLAAVTAISVAMAWVYWRTKGSLLLTMLMHAAINNTAGIVTSASPVGATNPFYLNAPLVTWLVVGVLWIGAAYFLVRMRGASLDGLPKQSAFGGLPFTKLPIAMNYKSIAVVILASILAPSLAVHGAVENSREKVIRIVSQIQRADYEGDRATLKKCYEELMPFLENKELASRIRYWRGFARWRDGINAGNESVDPNEMEKLFLAGVDEFKAALAIDPEFVDAKVGMISCLGYVVYFHRNEKERAQELVKPIFALVAEAKAAAPDNPRLIWVCGPILWYTPVDRGGGLDKVIENYERGLEVCEKLKPVTDALEPGWGKPELLMSLAYTQLTRNPPEIEKAERNARAALEIVPYWHYARDILLPQIAEAKAKQAKQTP